MENVTGNSRNRPEKLEELIRSGSIILFDGATGTEFIKKGLTGCNEFHNIDHRDEVSDIARRYFDAGSDAVLTNTFQGSDIILGQNIAKYNRERSVYGVNKAGVELAVKARSEAKYVVASVGSTGGTLRFNPLSETEIIEAYRPQIEGLRDGGVDAIAFETFIDINELQYAIKAARYYSDLPCICSMTFDKTSNGEYLTQMRISIPKAAETLMRYNPIAIGSNCGNGIDNMIEVVREYKSFLGKEDVGLYAKPNAGNPIFVQRKTVYQETPREFAEKLPTLIGVGATLVGGCCGTGPEHIMEMRKFLDSMK